MVRAVEALELLNTRALVLHDIELPEWAKQSQSTSFSNTDQPLSTEAIVETIQSNEELPASAYLPSATRRILPDNARLPDLEDDDLIDLKLKEYDEMAFDR